jgi:hypothetical protein
MLGPTNLFQTPVLFATIPQKRDEPFACRPWVFLDDAEEGSPMADDLAQTLLSLTRKHLTLSLRTLVMRDLSRHRSHLIQHYLRRHGITQDWDAFMAQADKAHQRAIEELLTHNAAHRRLAQAKAELDRVLTSQAYAACTAPLLTDSLHETALRLVTHRLTFAEDQYADAESPYMRELWEEQLDYYRELQALLQHQVYDAAVPLH